MNTIGHKRVFAIGLLTGCLLLGGCSVGAKLHVDAPDVTYPVSFTSGYYDRTGAHVTSNMYEEVESFSFSFRRVGVSSVVDIERRENLSSRLDALIEEHNGDAIVNLEVSVNNPGVNSGLLFVKSVSIMVALVTIPATIAQPGTGLATAATVSTVLSFFTPGIVEARIDGVVVRER